MKHELMAYNTYGARTIILRPAYVKHIEENHQLNIYHWLVLSYQ